MPKSTPHEVNQKDLARILGLSTRQIRNLEAQGLPHRAEGNQKLYPIPESVQWYMQQAVDRAQDKAESQEKAESERRKLAAEAKLAEIKAAEAEGRLIPLEVYEEDLSRTLDAVRAKLLNIPGAWSPAVVGCRDVPTALTRLRPLVHSMLGEVVGLADELPDEWDDDDD